MLAPCSARHAASKPHPCLHALSLTHTTFPSPAAPHEKLAWCCVNLWHHVSGTERRIFLPEQGNEWAAYVALSAEQRAELLLGLCYLVMGQGEVNAEVNYWYANAYVCRAAPSLNSR